MEVKSSMIKAVHHDSDNQTLTVTFRNGKEYVYPNVSQQEFQELITAESIGSHFSQHIKGKK